MKRLSGATILMVLCLILPLLLLVPGYTHFIYHAGSEYSDLTLSHYPNLVFLKQSLQETGTVPLWSNTIFSGYPFAADPLSGIGYPFTWILLVFPQPFGYNLVTSLHLLIGAIGILLVLRKYGVGFPAAILGAISFEWLPKLLGHYTAGHVSLVWAVSLTIWIVYAELRYREQPKSLWRYGSGIVLGLITLADVRWAPYGGLLFAALRIATLLSANFHRTDDEKLTVRGFLSQTILAGWEIVLNGLIMLCISAVLWLPLLQYSNLSARSQMGLTDRMFFSLPAEKLTGLIFPEIFGNWELWVYVGAFGVISAIGLLFRCNRPAGSAFWLWVSLISLIWALGINNPLMHLISELPGLSLLRVPSRSLIIFGLSACLLIGFFCDLVFKRIALQKGLRLSIFAITAFEIFLTLAARISTGEWNINFLWGAFAWVLVATVLFLLDRFPTIPVSLGFGFLLFLQLLDLGGLNLVKSKFYTADQLTDAKPSLVEWLMEQDGVFRVYSPSYSISQLDAAKAGLELADGISPLHVQSYDRFMVEASGVTGTGYSVSIPPFRTGNPDTDNMKAIPSAGLLGILNVRYLCSEFPVDAEGFDFVQQIDDTFIYENRLFRPRAWFQSSQALDVTGGNLLDAEFDFIERTPNSIQLRLSEGGGYLVLSEIAYPGWQVTVDQNPAELLSIEDLLRGVEVPEGTHEVTFRFRPLTVYLGAAISLLSVAAGVILLLILRTRRGSHV